MKRPRADSILSGIVILLVMSGALIFLSASLGLLAKSGSSLVAAVFSQIGLGLGGGAIALWIAYRLPLKMLRKYALIIFSLSYIATLAVFLPHIGVSANGARRWIDLGVTTFQTSELLKIGYVVLVAAWFSTGKARAQDVIRGLVPFSFVTALVGAALLMQPDTDTFLIIAASGAAMTLS